MIVSRQALEAGRSVAIYSLPRLLAELRRTFDDDAQHSYTELLDRLASIDLLHIDDVGAEQSSPWVLEQLYALINARYEEERSVILTTNIIEQEELGEADRRAHGLAPAGDVRADPDTRGGRSRHVPAVPQRRARELAPTLCDRCRAWSSWAPSGAMRARARSSTSWPSARTLSCASRAATTPATRSSATARRGSSTSSRPASSTRASSASSATARSSIRACSPRRSTGSRPGASTRAACG